MCGIFCIFAESNLSTTENLSKIFQEFNYNISRRGPNYNKIEICNVHSNILFFFASVLWLQGKNLTKQPLSTINDHLLVYNGDLFDQETEKTRNEHGDTKIFSELFNSSSISKNLYKLNGPFAFICLDKTNGFLYFGRDKYGRRSLLLGKSNDGKIILTSVAKKIANFKFIEVPSLGLFHFDLNNKKLCLEPWYSYSNNFKVKLEELEEFLDKKIDVSFKLNFENSKEFIEPSSNVDLINLKYENMEDFLNSNGKINENVENIKKILENSLRKRLNPPKFCRNCFENHSMDKCNHPLIGILFSGGVDCAILAYLSDKFIDKNRQIDLLNVAFSDSNNFETPDRINGIQTLNELRELCPERCWNFVEINISFDELNKERKARISDLIYPLNTILDDSLGCALWFASRGETKNYISPCRVLLVGMGADELFGGYTRHRAAFKRENWSGLHKILQEDWENLPYRNLGRDDRVVSDHGRQLRTPYLDENLVEFVRNLNCWEKTLPVDKIPQEIGMKILLRCLAFSLGLKQAAKLKKKAFQFGSKIANSKENAHEISPRL